MILVSQSEPGHVRALGKVTNTPEDYGCDVLITSRRHKLGIQRKKFPEDLIASIADSRLPDQLVKMQELDRAVVVMVGYPSFTRDGALIMDNWGKRKWMFETVWGTVASIVFEAGIGVMWVRDEGQFVDLVGVLEDWNRKEKHSTLAVRSRPKAKGWGISRKLQESHFLQGLPSVGPELSERIVGAFGGVPMRWTVTLEEMRAVEGIGAKKVEKIGEIVRFDEQET